MHQHYDSVIEFLKLEMKRKNKESKLRLMAQIADARFKKSMALFRGE